MGICSSGSGSLDEQEKHQLDEKPEIKEEEEEELSTLTFQQLEIVDQFYIIFDKDKDGSVTAESIANLNMSPKEEIVKLFSLHTDSVGEMSKEDMIKVFEKAKAAFCKYAGDLKGTAFITEMLKVLLAVTKGEMSEEEGNRHLAAKSTELNIVNNEDGVSPLVSTKLKT